LVPEARLPVALGAWPREAAEEAVAQHGAAEAAGELPDAEAVLAGAAEAWASAALLQAAAEVPEVLQPEAAAERVARHAAAAVRAERPSQAAARPSAAASVCRRDRVLPWPVLRRSARFARAQWSLQNASQ
jgi:hypothetical protein